MNKEYYKQQYINALERIKQKLIALGVDVFDGTAITYEFEKSADAEEVAGYYIYNEGDNALNQWRMSTEDIEMTSLDKTVTKILERLYENKGIELKELLGDTFFTYCLEFGGMGIVKADSPEDAERKVREAYIKHNGKAYEPFTETINIYELDNGDNWFADSPDVLELLHE